MNIDAMVPNKCLVIDDQFIPCSSIMVHPDGSITALIPLENKAVLMLELADGGTGVLTLYYDTEDNRKVTAITRSGAIVPDSNSRQSEVAHSTQDIMTAITYFGSMERG